jgi:lipopolysaccharide/colanic/teichoic acid biosynthesis glycosyltransferase
MNQAASRVNNPERTLPGEFDALPESDCSHQAERIARLRPAEGKRGRARYLVTRLFEIVVALTVLVLALPVMLWVGWIVKRGTPGPALFFQHRVGQDRKLFRFVKFRTMYVDARERFPELYAYAYDEESLSKLRFKVEDDPRVTPQGRWLRQSTLDEIPNFWNVLTGDMALVGPRPEIPEMLTYYVGDMNRKFDVRPGITGLAQVSGRGRLGFHDTVALDVDYVDRQSLLLDIKILLRTLKIVAIGDGAF